MDSSARCCGLLTAFCLLTIPGEKESIVLFGLLFNTSSSKKSFKFTIVYVF